MRFLSQVWQPAVSVSGRQAAQVESLCKSQRLLWECGLVRSGSHGLPVLLPLAARALHKLETLVSTCLECVGASRCHLPALVPSSLWSRSGRLQADSGHAEELMTLTDRQHRTYLLAPTHEECFASLLAETYPLSHRQLPILLYQISAKYRDERRAKHGLLRARHFLMMDSYGAHGCSASAQTTYCAMGEAFQRIFHSMGLSVHRVQAPGGAMGGSLSHEWQLPANIGEDSIDICPSCSSARLGIGTEGERDGLCDQCGQSTRTVNSIEVGHTFCLDSTYSIPLEATFTPASGAPRPIIMTCYGIGLTRLLAASVEALSSECSIVWPEVIAPFRTLLIGPKEDSKESRVLGPTGLNAVCAALATSNAPCGATAGDGGPDTAPSSGHTWHHDDDILVDDRHHLSVGRRLLLAEKTGYPVIVVLGRQLLDSEPKVELRTRDVTSASYHVTSVTLAQLLDGGGMETRRQHGGNRNI